MQRSERAIERKIFTSHEEGTLIHKCTVITRNWLVGGVGMDGGGVERECDLSSLD